MTLRKQLQMLEDTLNEARQQHSVKTADLDKLLGALRNELVAKDDELRSLQAALQRGNEQYRSEITANKQALQKTASESQTAAKKAQDTLLEWQSACAALKADLAKTEKKLLQSEDIIADYKKIVDAVNQSKDVRLAELEDTEKKLEDVKGALEVSWPVICVAGTREVHTAGGRLSAMPLEGR